MNVTVMLDNGSMLYVCLKYTFEIWYYG